MYCCVQFYPVTKSYLTLCDPMDCSPSGYSVLHYLLKFIHIHIRIHGLSRWHEW